ncbi:MAG: tRNA lysidine(34) synthetase TilS [Ignavibacteriaceae bacterium]
MVKRNGLLMHPLEEKVISFIKENKLILPGSKVVVGFSGGPDSLFLLHFLNKYKQLFKISLIAAHVNHNLRGTDSDSDEVFCRKTCSQFGIELFPNSANVRSLAKTRKISIEEAARISRYDFFLSVCKEHNCTLIATAHSKDDNAETVLLNLFKGAGVAGLGGIPVKRDNIIRPVLCCEKEEIVGYLKSHKLKYRTDKSNYSDDFQRNFVRNKIIPQIKKINPNFSGNILNQSFLLREASAVFLASIVLLKKKYLLAGKGSLSIKNELFKEHSEFIAGEMVRNEIKELFDQIISYIHTKEIIALSEKQSGTRISLSGGLVATRERDYVIISCPEATGDELKVCPVGTVTRFGDRTFSSVEVSKGEVKITADKKTEFIDADKLSGMHFFLRRWLPGDVFSPIGLKGRKKVSDVLTNIKVPSDKRRENIVLLNDGKIVWLVGFRLDDRFKITNRTKRFIKLTIR